MSRRLLFVVSVLGGCGGNGGFVYVQARYAGGFCNL